MTIKATNIGSAASASDIVFDALRLAIIEGSLAEGAPLRQDEIARMFNTSRIPVREALTRLEEQGLITTQRYKGAAVAGLSVVEAEEIFDFRALLESHVIAVAVPKMSTATLEEALRYADAFSNADAPSAWGEFNRKFHYTLYRDSALSYHLKTIDTALDRVDRFLRAQLTLTNGMDRAREDHDAIFAACKKGDATRAADLTRDHILGAKTKLIDYLRSVERI